MERATFVLCDLDPEVCGMWEEAMERSGLREGVEVLNVPVESVPHRIDCLVVPCNHRGIPASTFDGVVERIFGPEMYERLRGAIAMRYPETEECCVGDCFVVNTHGEGIARYLAFVASYPRTDGVGALAMQGVLQAVEERNCNEELFHWRVVASPALGVFVGMPPAEKHEIACQMVEAIAAYYRA